MKGWKLGLALLASLPWTAQAGSVGGACDAASFQTVLQAQAGGQAIQARAYWLDRRLIQWPMQPAQASSRFKLYYSASASLQFEPGQAMQGADGFVELDVSGAALPAALAQRFKFIAEGPRLALREADLPRLPALLKSQVLLVHESASGQVLAASALQAAGILDDIYASAEKLSDLGAQPRRSGTGFKLWAPTAQRVALCSYVSGKAPAAAELAMKFDPATGAWSVRLPKDHSGHYYSYLVDVFVPGVGLVRNRVTDPYSISLTTDSRRSYIADLDAAKLKPKGWDATPSPKRVKAQTDMVIYELHVRDFSIGDATVSAANRGKYAAFTETRSNGMKHLQALSKAGMTDVHLLPVFDFATVPESGCKTPQVPAAVPDSEAQQAAVMAVAASDCFNWGYDPLHYTAPEGSYSSDAADGARRIIEFRQMVQALHRADLRVGMDVVYNHTSASGQQQNSVLDRIVPGYYQRLSAAGSVERSTCCDNTATEHRMMAKLVVDSTETWARHYKIDSFRFDLMAHQPRALMEALQARVDKAAGRHVNLIGEGWNFGEIANGARFVQASQLSLNGSGIGTFSDRGRDAARGGSAGDSGEAMFRNKGWLNGNGEARTADMIRVGLAGSLRDYELQTWTGERRALSDMAYGDQPAGYVSQPTEVVNYVDNHDNQTLFDVNVMKLPRETSKQDRARVQMLGAALTALSQGVAYYHAGIELLRSKSLDRNSYDSGDWFNRLDWTYTDNGFGAGLPPKGDNGADYPLLQPLLADAVAIKPGPAEIAWMRDAFLDLLKIRASSTLFRLTSSEAVKQRLQFLNTGAEQNPAVIAAVLDGQGLAGAGFKRLAYFINTAAAPQQLAVPTEANKAYRLHPVQSSRTAADRRSAEEARYEAETGRFSVPARSVVVFVIH